MHKIRVPLKERSYNILVGEGLLKSCGSILRRLNIGRDALVITNARLLKLYRTGLEGSLKKAGLSAHFETAPDSEKAKSTQVVGKLANRISAFDKRKELFIVAFGGGVIGDLAGFIAAVYKRGVPYAQMPTTLLAQVDSAIGGKVAVDLAIAKNLIGSFYQPRIVLSDVSVLRSLSLREMRNGLAEVIKYGAIADHALFEYLEVNYKKILSADKKALESVIARSSGIKARIVGKDELDTKGLRAILNYGHTIGHAIEAAAGYSKRYHHGEAIALGMIGAARISAGMGMMKKGDAARIELLIKRVGLPSRIAGLKFSSIYEAHFHDKKFIHKKNRFVLPTGIGKARVVEDVPDRLIQETIKGLF